jgi:hypothetical protein
MLLKLIIYSANYGVINVPRLKERIFLFSKSNGWNKSIVINALINQEFTPFSRNVKLKCFFLMR